MREGGHGRARARRLLNGARGAHSGGMRRPGAQRAGVPYLSYSH